MVEAHVLGAEVVLARAHDGGREGDGAAHRLLDGVMALQCSMSIDSQVIFGPPTV